MSSAVGFVRRIYRFLNPPEFFASPDCKPIKFGILGAANIAPLALISPAKSHPEVTVHAVAARDKSRAEAFAKKHNIPKSYAGPNGYQELLSDPEIDAVYNPLPNGLHYEWTMKALAAGKHVLLEKPSANSAEETRKMYEFAESKGLVLLEAFHYRFHPAIQRTKAIIDSGELGAIKHVEAYMVVSKGFVKDGDIRFNYELGGGALMDMGCYTMNCIRYLSSSNPISVLSANHELYVPPGSPPSFVPNVDRGSTATLELPNNATAQIKCDLALPRLALPRLSAKVECEGGSVEIYNFVMPVLYHSITVRKRGQGSRTEKAYTFREAKMEGKGEEWWSTYRYQLEAFVDMLKGRTPAAWLDKDDAITNMEWIEQVYQKTGLVTVYCGCAVQYLNMIISEKHSREALTSRARNPLKARPLDLLYFCFFLIHLPATLLVDIAHLYPTWLVPSFLRSLQRTYLLISNDPLVGVASGFFGPKVEQLVWFNSFVALEVLFQVPVFIIGARGLYKGSRAIYVLILIYGASTFTTVLPCIAVIFNTPETTATTLAQKITSITFEQRVLLLSSYIPFALIPLMMTVDMAFRILNLVRAGINATDEEKWK